MSDPVITFVEYSSPNFGSWALTRTDGVVTQIRTVSPAWPEDIVSETEFDPVTGLPVPEDQPLLAPVALVEMSTDADGTRPWQTEERAFDADGNLLRITREMDNGTVSMRFETDTDQDIIYRADPADVVGWSVRTEIRDGISNALQTSSVVRDDDVFVLSAFDDSGAITGRAFLDLGDTYSWSERVFGYYEDGSLASFLRLNDNGILTERTFGTDGNLAEQRVTDTADIRDFEFIDTDVFADGSRIVLTDFDDGRLVERVFDADGVLRSRIVEDVDDAYDYARIEATFDETGALIERIVTPDPVADELLF
ncbi:MAG: hypothetical protein AAF919_04370 [Pseudomonadota bacterium]